MTPSTPPPDDDPNASPTAADAWSKWTWAVVFGLALLFGLMEAAQLRLGSSVLGEGMPIGVAIVRVLPYWLLAACVMPLAMAISRRLRAHRFLLQPNVPALVVTGLGFSLLALSGRVALAILDPRTSVVLRRTPLQLFQTYFALDLLAYTAFVGTLYAFHYYRETRRREITASRLQASLAEARLNGLEARVDPDFLLSTLNDISALAKQEQQRPVLDTLERLSEVLRAALGNERPEEIRLARELDLLDGYVGDGQAASRASVRIDRAVTPEALEALVPRGLLAQIVEGTTPTESNPWTEPQRVAIRAARVDDQLRLEIATDRRSDAGEADWPAHRGALPEVRERLVRLYGSGQTIEQLSADGTVVVALSLPFRKALAGEERAAPDLSGARPWGTPSLP
jgi:hypothetical protein